MLNRRLNRLFLVIAIAGPIALGAAAIAVITLNFKYEDSGVWVTGPRRVTLISSCAFLLFTLSAACAIATGIWYLALASLRAQRLQERCCIDCGYQFTESQPRCPECNAPRSSSPGGGFAWRPIGILLGATVVPCALQSAYVFFTRWPSTRFGSFWGVDGGPDFGAFILCILMGAAFVALLLPLPVWARAFCAVIYLPVGALLLVFHALLFNGVMFGYWPIP